MKYEQNLFIESTGAENVKKIKCFDTICDLWNESVQNYTDDLALADLTRQFTYAQLDREVSKFRAILKQNGLNKGDFVGVFAPNSIEWAKAYLAIETLGCVAVLLPPHLPGQALFGCGMKFDMKAIVYHPALQEKVDELNAMPHKMTLINIMEKG